MKTKYLKAITLLAVILCLSGTFMAAVFGVSGNCDGYDFYHYGSPKNTTLSSADILEEYLGESISEYERNFLERFSELCMSFSSAVSTEKVGVVYDGEQNLLKVLPKTYEYEAKSGRFRWIPTAVEFGEEKKTYTEGEEVVFNLSAAPTESDRVKVYYSSSKEICREDINFIKNFLYDTAKYIKDSEEYVKAVEEYENYLNEKRIYDEALALYNRYIEDKKVYLEQLAEYDNYERAVEEYNAAYAKYLEYLAKLEQMREEVEIYNAYLEKTETVNTQLAVIEAVKTPMTDKRTLYAAVMGSTVDEVLANKSLITSEAYGVDEAAVDMAGDATEILRNLMTEYFKLKTEEQKYNFYIVNYENLSDNFYKLLISLDELYKNDKVRGTLVMKDKDEKYVILLAQLALITNSLIDGELKDYRGNIAYNSEWRVRLGQSYKTVLEILENKTYLTDTEAAKPLEDGYPAVPENITLPEEVEKPEKPLRPQKPSEPIPAANPGDAPDAAAEPIRPSAASRVADAVRKLSHTEAIDLVAKLEAGEITRRSESASGFSLNLLEILEKRVVEDKVKVTFKDENLNYIGECFADRGSAVIYEGEIPHKASDAEFDYIFRGWKSEISAFSGDTASEESVNLVSAESDLILVPLFEKVRRSYSVFWNIEGEISEERYFYGETPNYKGEPEKAGAGDYIYTFAGWNKELTPVTESVTYTARFEEEYLVPNSSGGAAVIDDGEILTLDFGACRDTVLDIGRALERAAGQRALRIKTIIADIAFSYSEVKELFGAGVKTLTVSALNRANITYVYSVTAKNAEGEILSLPVSADMAVANSLKGNSFANLCFVKDGVRKYSSFRFSEDGLLNFSANLGEEYIMTLEFSVAAHFGDMAKITLSKDLATPGDRVDISVELEDGVLLDKIIVTARDGTEINTVGSGFIMPMQDVDVGVVVRIKNYTVVFKADGKTVATVRVPHGEKPQPPADPIKQNDSKYSYKFLGWKPSIEEATSDTVYEAVYEKTRLPEKTKPTGPIISDGVERILITLAVCLTVLFAGTVTSLAVITVRIVKKRNAARRKTQNNQKSD